MNKIDAKNGRFYKINEEFYPSSTTILSARPMNFFLREYLQVHTKEEADKLLKQAGLQGSKIHHTIELVLQGEVIPSSGIIEEQITKTKLISDEDYGDKDLLDYLKKEYSEKEDKMMRGFFNWWNEFKAQTIKSEEIVYSKKYKYAGTADWIGFIENKNKKELCIIDWKTGKGLYDDYNLQVASYVYAYNEMNKGKKGFKKINKAYLLQLGVNKCGYKFQEIKDLKKEFKRFIHTLETWRDINPNAKPAEEYQFMQFYKL